MTGDGTTTTVPTILRSLGCYSFVVALASTTTAVAVTGAPGAGSETVLVADPSSAGNGAAGAAGATAGGMGSGSGGQATARGPGGLLAMTGIELAAWLAVGTALVLAGLALVCSDRRRYHRVHRLR